MRIKVIAEFAQGFEGNEGLARQLLRGAIASGADAAKFQLVYANELATPDYRHYELFRSLEMSDGAWASLASYAKANNIELYFDIFGPRSLRLAEMIGASSVKLHGTDLANIGLLEMVGRSSIPQVILGAGGGVLSEIEEAVSRLGKKHVVILLGFQGYPTPIDANQIWRVGYLKNYFQHKNENVVIGFADHAAPDTALRYALAAVAIGYGATVLEKHMTISRALKLEDSETALNPEEFAEFVQVAHDCAFAFGSVKDAYDSGMSEAENNYRGMIRRHVVAANDLSKGAVISPADIVLKRTEAKWPITSLEDAYGRKLRRALVQNQAIEIGDIEGGI